MQCGAGGYELELVSELLEGGVSELLEVVKVPADVAGDGEEASPLGGLRLGRGVGRGAEGFQHVLRTTDQQRAVADQDIAAGGAGVERVAGDGHHVAAIVEGGLRGDQAAGFGGVAYGKNDSRQRIDDSAGLVKQPVADADQRITVDIYDAFGKKVVAQQYANSGSLFNTVLNLDGGLAAGVYMVNITINDRTSLKRLTVL